jgi:hypothetical protein
MIWVRPYGEEGSTATKCSECTQFRDWFDFATRTIAAIQGYGSFIVDCDGARCFVLVRLDSETHVLVLFVYAAQNAKQIALLVCPVGEFGFGTFQQRGGSLCAISVLAMEKRRQASYRATCDSRC